MKMTIKVFRQYTVLIVVGAILGLLLHIGIIRLDTMLQEKPIYIDLEKNFWQSAFSFPFLPMLILEVLLSTVTIFLWIKMKRAIHRAHELDLKRVNHETTVKSFQKIMALLGEHIASNNNQILSKIEFRRKQGQQTSETIENASRNISKILKILSEVSYVEPYLSTQQNRGLDLHAELERRINEMKELQSSRLADSGKFEKT
ncbi:MAG: hypothetical protein HQM12_12805 [SAR324 cluster bacterium]|nr:hypothetical protein [SAR324 cluster bacterium]